MKADRISFLRMRPILDDCALHAQNVVERWLSGRFQLGIEVGDDLLERLDRLLDRGNLHQLPARDRASAVLQGDDEVTPLLLELNER